MKIQGNLEQITLIPVYVVEVTSFIQIHLFPFNPPLRLYILNTNKSFVSKGQVVAYPSKHVHHYTWTCEVWDDILQLEHQNK
jgi:hypothetical protein